MKNKIINTPVGKAEVMMTMDKDGKVKVHMSKKRYEKLMGRIHDRQ